MTDNPNTLSERYERLREENRELRERLERVYEASIDGISHVAIANYQSREDKAMENIRKAYEENHENER